MRHAGTGEGRGGDEGPAREVRAEGLSFAQAVPLGAMVEPAVGEPEMPPLLAELDALGVPLTAIVEPDHCPTPPDVPPPIATRTQRHYRHCGLRVGRP